MSVVEPGTVWMADNHDLMVSIPLGQKEGATEAHIRRRLSTGVQARFAGIDIEDLASFTLAIHNGPLGIYEDDEHGLQYGLVIRPHKIETPA